MSITDPHVLQAALSYAARGWHVLPCDPATKRPVTDHGLKDATCAAAAIRAWWTRWPGAMIGCRTGKESGILAIDLDVDAAKGVDGIAAFAKLAEGKELPETDVSRTPRGGRHLFFKWADGVRNSAGLLAPGVDVRCENGSVIMPPSRRWDGKYYESIVGVSELPEAPRWIVDILVAKSEPTDADDDLAAFARAAARQCPNGANGYGEAALAAECSKLASARPGTRNHALNAAAFNLGQLVAGGVLHESEVRLRLRSAAAACGLLKDDGGAACRATVDSGLAAGMAKPRVPA